MQVSNECYTKINEFVDEFSKTVKMTTEGKELLNEMIADEFGEDLTEHYANTYEGYLDEEDKY